MYTNTQSEYFLQQGYLFTFSDSSSLYRLDPLWGPLAQSHGSAQHFSQYKFLYFVNVSLHDLNFHILKYIVILIDKKYQHHIAFFYIFIKETL